MALGLSGLSGLSGVSGAPALPPVTRTLQIAAGADDAFVYKQDTAYPPGGAATLYGGLTYIQATKRLNGGNYDICNPVLRWSRGGVPAGAPTGAVLRVWIINAASVDSRNLICEWITLATPGTISTSDYAVNAATIAGTFPLSGLTVGAYNLLTLSIANFPAAGEIALRLTIDGGAPTDYNYTQFYSFENVASKDPPQLAVTSPT